MIWRPEEASPAQTSTLPALNISLPTCAEQQVQPQPSQATKSSTSLGTEPEPEQRPTAAAERPTKKPSGSQRRLMKRLRAAMASQAGEVSSP
jgi:hypothetical protein